METAARNDPCPCGSGLKYKHCCLKTGGVHQNRRRQQAQWVAIAAVVVAIVVAIFYGTGPGVAVGLVGILVAGALVFFSSPPPPRSGGSPGAINFGR